jgi:putative transposase
MRELDAVIARPGRPMTIVSDNGTEFTSTAILSWCLRTAVDWHSIALGKPMQNRRRLIWINGVRLLYIESFSGRFRDEFLNEVPSTKLPDARARNVAWKDDDNRHRPHTTRGNIPSAEFAMKIRLKSWPPGPRNQLEDSPHPRREDAAQITRNLFCSKRKMGLRPVSPWCPPYPGKRMGPRSILLWRVDSGSAGEFRQIRVNREVS